jgi:poly(A) polymerase
MKTRLDPSRECWMRAKETRAVLDALASAGGEARFVGGAVRNALLNRAVDDIDIATPLLPDDVMRALKAAHITAIPTGIEHGTVTAILDRKAFEITTLRRDVSTDGRRATVAFSTDWAEDAGRRDFTINALYASGDGELFDFTGGLDDLDKGRVCFIGDPLARIREDYLRILRLFRFHAWYGKGDIDEDARCAARAGRAGLKRLSGERVQKEMLRLLAADNPSPVLEAMAADGILAEIVSDHVNLDRIERLVAIDAANFFPPDSVLRLAALLPPEPTVAAAVAERLRLSNENRDRIVDLAGARETIVPHLPVRDVRRLLYQLGAQRFRDRVLLRWAEDPKPGHTVAWRALLALGDAWIRPHFPLTGRDAIAAGVPQGPLVGRVLAEVEEWWIAADFTDDRFSLAERLKAVALATMN